MRPPSTDAPSPARDGALLARGSLNRATPISPAREGALRARGPLNSATPISVRCTCGPRTLVHLRRLVYPAADIVPQAHVHGVIVAAALHDVEGRYRQYAGEDAGQRLLERGVAVRRPEDDGPAGPQREQRELYAGLGIEAGVWPRAP